MNTFLKVLLIAVLIVLALKLLPFAFGVAVLLGGLSLIVIAVTASAAVALFSIAAVLLAVLSPVWLPILAVIGLIALVRRSRRGPTAA